MAKATADTRASAFVPHPEAEDFNKYMLTLLAQRRHLQANGVQKLFHGGGGSGTDGVPFLFKVQANNLTINKERKDLQQEVSLPLKAGMAPGLNTAEALKARVAAAGAPLAGSNDADMLLLHFRSRQASLAVERHELGMHMSAIRRTHFAHVVTESLPQGMAAARQYAGLTASAAHMDHVGSADHHSSQGASCNCTVELELAGQCMAALQAAEVDVGARVARLEQALSSGGSSAAKAAVTDDDWMVALRHAVSTGPGTRLGQRLVDRLAFMPFSHHHRYPLYEKACSAALERDHLMAEAHTRVPHMVIRHASDARRQMDSYLDSFAEEDDIGSGASDTVAPATEYGAAGTHDLKQDALGQHHQELYLAHKLLPRVMHLHSLRWPRAATVIDLHPNTVASTGEAGEGSAAAALAQQASSSAIHSPHHDDTDLVQEPVQLEDCCTGDLDGLAPSIEGDMSAGHVAVLCSTAKLVNEHLKAENDFLEVSDTHEVAARLKMLAALHVTRWSEEEPPAAEASTGGALSHAASQEALRPLHLEPKTMEAMYMLRFLKTKRNRLRVLHYINAMVSLQLALLRDEELELKHLDPQATTVPKPFTCPVEYAQDSTPSDSGSALFDRSSDQGESDAGTEVGPGRRGSFAGSRCSRTSRFSRTSKVSRFSRFSRRRRVSAHGLGVAGTGVHRNLAAQSSFMSTVTTAKSECHSNAPTRQADASQYAFIDAEETWGRDQWVDDDEAGVLVLRGDGRFIVYKQAVVMFEQVEEEMLRLASHHCEAYAQQLHAAGRGHEVDLLDWHAILEDIWQHESDFSAARHKLLLAYLSAYRHASDWGVLDMFTGANTADGPKPFPKGRTSVSHDAWAGVGCNSRLPQVLGARQQLRRELIDTTFRRPNNALGDSYFAGRHIHETLSVDMEAALVSQLTSATHREERNHLSIMFEAALSQATAAGLPAPDGWQALWRAGLPAGLVYGPAARGLKQRSLWQEGALMAGVGAAAGALPVVLRKIVSQLADQHQIRDYVELAELRRVVLQSALVEMSVLLREEGFRAHAAPPKMPPDSKLRDALNRDDEVGHAAQSCQLSWLVTSLTADNPTLIEALVAQAGCGPRMALQVILTKEQIIRDMYQAEVAWLVHVTQSRALGRRLLAPDVQGIDWKGLDMEGNARKAEQLSDLWQECEPSDVAPPGAGGPPTSTNTPATSAPEGLGHVPASKFPSLMIGVGRSGQLGGVWRQPPLALAEFTTHPTESLQIHSVSHLAGLLEPSGLKLQALQTAARAQALKAASLDVAIQHNQVLLDWVIRKLDRRRRLAMWRAATVDGLSDDHGSIDMVVGAPPGSYMPSAFPGADQLRSSYSDTAVPTPLLEDPPIPKLAQYRQQQRTSTARMPGSRPARDQAGSVTNLQGEATGNLPGSGDAGQTTTHAWLGVIADMVDARAAADLRAVRARLVRAVSGLWLDVGAVKLNMRHKARQRYVMCAAEQTTNHRASISDATSGKPHVVSAHEQELKTLEVFDQVYVQGTLDLLVGPALKIDITACTRHLAITLLGSTGGYGHNWGILWDIQLRRLVVSRDNGPFFDGPGGIAKLISLLQDYGPLWQHIQFHLSDKADDPDVMDYMVPTEPLPPGLMILDASGSVRLDQLWEIPAPLDVLGWVPSKVMPTAPTTTPTTAPATAPTTAPTTSPSPAPTASSAHTPPPASPPPATPSPDPSDTKHGSAPVRHRPARRGASSLNLATSLAAKSGASTPAPNPGLQGTAPVGPPALPETLLLLEPADKKRMEQGVTLGRLLLKLLEYTLQHASLLAPAAHMAAGGDVSRASTMVPPEPRGNVSARDGWGSQVYLTGSGLLDHMGAVNRARVAPLLPGALMAPSLQALKTKLAYLVQPQGFQAGKAGAGPVAAATVPGAAALELLEREASLFGRCCVIGVARARDTLGGGSSSSKQAWSASAPLEHYLAVSLASCTPSCLSPPPMAVLQGWSVPLPASVVLTSGLRLQDTARMCIHNELSKLQLLLERVTAECGIKPAVQPRGALGVQESVLAQLWMHDRLRDAWLHRAMLMEQPQDYGYETAHSSHFLKRYHTLLIMQPGAPYPLPDQSRDWMVSLYESRVLEQANQLVQQAIASAGGGAHAEESVVLVPAGGSATAPGKPGWLAQGEAFASPEARAMEAACVVMKQALDMQAIQVSLLRLNEDCAQLTGLAAHRATLDSDSQSDLTEPGQRDSAQGQMQFQTDVPSHMIKEAVVGPAVQSLVRKLLTKKLPAQGPDQQDSGFVVTSEELTRWLAEAVQTISAEGSTRAILAADMATWERRQLQATHDELQDQVGKLSVDHDVFLRRQAIRVDTQIVDKAMGLLQELSSVRRSALRSYEDARRATEMAYQQAQAEHSAKISELQNALLVSSTNAALQRADMQKAALEAMMEVRRETLQRCFGAFGTHKGTVGSTGSVDATSTTGSEVAGATRAFGDINHALELEEQIEALQTEIIDMQRAIIKVQTWFRMRSSVFQAACMREVVAARQRAADAVGRQWEEREAHDLVTQTLQLQLKATQSDLELSAASVAKTSAQLSHALISNKRLLSWKVGMQPQLQALQTKLATATRNREAWTEWVQSKQSLMQHVSKVLAKVDNGELEDVAADVNEDLKAQVAAMRAEVGRLRDQLAHERTSRAQMLEPHSHTASSASPRLVHSSSLKAFLRSPTSLVPDTSIQPSSSPGLLSPRAGRELPVGGPDGVSVSPGVWSAGGAAKVPTAGLQSASLSGGPLAAVSAEVLVKRHGELQAAYQQEQERTAYLQRTLQAVRAVVPEVVAALEVTPPADLRAASAADTADSPAHRIPSRLRMPAGAAGASKPGSRQSFHLFSGPVLGVKGMPCGQTTARPIDPSSPLAGMPSQARLIGRNSAGQLEHTGGLQGSQGASAHEMPGTASPASRSLSFSPRPASAHPLSARSSLGTASSLRRSEESLSIKQLKLTHMNTLKMQGPGAG